MTFSSARRRRIPILLACALFISPVRAQEAVAQPPPAVPVQPPPADGDGAGRPLDPAAEGIDPVRLERLTALLQGYVADERLPGAVALVMRNGRVVYEQAIGRMGPGAQAPPLQPDHIFRLASMTKPMVSVALMTLWEEGRFQLDDPVSRFLPEFETAQVLVSFDEASGHPVTEPVRRPVTVRHLLTHTSGLGYGFIQDDAKRLYDPAGVPDFPALEKSLGATMSHLAGLPLLHHPGERFTYGLSTDMVGHLVEVLTEQSLEAVLRERLWQPLAMDDTSFYVPEAKRERLVVFTMPGFAASAPATALVGYHESALDTLAADHPLRPLRAIVAPSPNNVSYLSGGAGANGTLRDYARFAQMILNGGVLDGQRVLGAKTVQLIGSNHTDELPLFGSSDRHFGLGFSVVSARGAQRNIGSRGTLAWGGAWGTSFFVDPVEQLVAVLLTNVWPNDHLMLRYEFPNVLYQALTESYGR